MSEAAFRDEISKGVSGSDEDGINSYCTYLLIQAVQPQRLVPVLLQLLHQLPALLHPLLRQLYSGRVKTNAYGKTVVILQRDLRALVLLRLVLLQLVLHVEQAAAELAQDVLWQGWAQSRDAREHTSPSHAPPESSLFLLGCLLSPPVSLRALASRCPCRSPGSCGTAQPSPATAAHSVT